MKKLIVTTALMLSMFGAVNAEASDVKSYCDTPKNVNKNDINDALTAAAMAKTFETVKYWDSLKPGEKIACGFILQDSIQKGIVGSKDKVLQLFVNLKENTNKNAKYKYTYTGKVVVSDYKRVADGYKTNLRHEFLSGKFEILPVFPPLPPIIAAPEPVVPPVAPPIILGEPPMGTPE